MKADIILLKYGEISLKGLNRPMFERQLISNVAKALAPLGKFSVRKSQSTIYVEPLEDSADTELAVERLSKVFGIVNICPAVKCEKTIESIERTTLSCLSQMPLKGKTFKVEAKREDKQFPMNSPQICRHMGGVILKNTEGLSVDVHNPDILVQIEIRKEAYVFTHKVSGAGGMPIGTAGRATLLLSGGIDSPVAGWMIAKRGVRLEAVHFHSHPYTSDRAKEKVIDLARLMSAYTGEIRLHVVPFTEIQLDIIEKCPKNYLTIIMRRLMMRIAEKISVQNNSSALITGESIGQVASQTLQSLAATNEVCTLPVYRPVIGFDKQEIVERSWEIGTYETSIQPFEDCCTIFVAKHPVTKPNLNVIHRSETKLEEKIDELMKTALETVEIIEID